MVSGPFLGSWETLAWHDSAEVLSQIALIFQHILYTSYLLLVYHFHGSEFPSCFQVSGFPWGTHASPCCYLAVRDWGFRKIVSQMIRTCWLVVKAAHIAHVLIPHLCQKPPFLEPLPVDLMLICLLGASQMGVGSWWWPPTLPSLEQKGGFREFGFSRQLNASTGKPKYTRIFPQLLCFHLGFAPICKYGHWVLLSKFQYD